MKKLKNLKCFKKIQRKRLGKLILNTLLKRIHFKVFTKNQIIYKPNDTINNIFFVIQGKINVYKLTIWAFVNQ